MSTTESLCVSDLVFKPWTTKQQVLGAITDTVEDFLPFIFFLFTFIAYKCSFD